MSKRSDSSQADSVALRHRLWATWGIVFAVTLVPVFLLSLFPALPRIASTSVSAVLGLAAVVLLVICVPTTRMVTPGASRCVAAVFGTVSVLLAWVVSRGDSTDSEMWNSVRLWLVASVVELVVALIGGFAFEMARRNRARLIESLSTFVAAGMVAWSAGGWVFAADAFSAPAGRWVSAAIVVVISVLLMIALSGGINADSSDGGNSAGRARLNALGIIPVALSGLAVPLTVLLVVVIF
ncbi:MAG: hypothetical protein LKJ47_08045 [Bifidobacteriaceae bacterium]|jgi:hypothetical protein|nr:hypothetical protein [Bifidobacteriaceae bacterium]